MLLAAMAMYFFHHVFMIQIHLHFKLLEKSKLMLKKLYCRFLINMLVVNILSSSLYLPLVLLSLLGGEGDSGEVAALQELLFQSVAHCIGALSVLSTLCTGIHSRASNKCSRRFHNYRDGPSICSSICNSVQNCTELYRTPNRLIKIKRLGLLRYSDTTALDNNERRPPYQILI